MRKLLLTLAAAAVLALAAPTYATAQNFYAPGYAAYTQATPYGFQSYYQAQTPFGPVAQYRYGYQTPGYLVTSTPYANVYYNPYTATSTWGPGYLNTPQYQWYSYRYGY